MGTVLTIIDEQIYTRNSKKLESQGSYNSNIKIDTTEVPKKAFYNI